MARFTHPGPQIMKASVVVYIKGGSNKQNIKSRYSSYNDTKAFVDARGIEFCVVVESNTRKLQGVRGGQYVILYNKHSILFSILSTHLQTLLPHQESSSVMTL
jgi:hypothetical protein